MTEFSAGPDLASLHQHLAAGEQAGADARSGPGATRRFPADPSDWNPPFCGEIDMVIKRDGRWFYQGSAITRTPLVKLFASVLRREGEDYRLVTPVEKVGIRVEDLPFLAVELRTEGTDDQQILHLRTTLDEWVTVSREHPLRFDPTAADGLAPAVLVRNGLWARLSRPLSFELAELGCLKKIDDSDWFGVFSQAMFFPMIEADALEQA